MGTRFYLELAGGVLLIIFGILFLRYLPITISEITTDSIFIGAGVLIIRRAILSRRVGKIEQPLGKKNHKSPSTKTGAKKIRQ